MRSGYRAAALVLLALPLLGMGALGGGAGGPPERDFAATFVDRDGTEVKARWVTAGGELALTGALGRGTLRVSFDDIRKVEFATDGRNGSVARLSLREGEPVDLKIRSSLTFSGQTGVGQYRIRARDLKSVDFQ